uniref:Uncharacterized protein n=1 Tax=Steinernema glaseri TaxID=37863 RepID=A0A1I7Y6E4_9BILA
MQVIAVVRVSPQTFSASSSRSWLSGAWRISRTRRRETAAAAAAVDKTECFSRWSRTGEGTERRDDVGFGALSAGFSERARGAPPPLLTATQMPPERAPLDFSRNGSATQPQQRRRGDPA